eukprot:TRINITY_DN9751_c0_g1_i1.p1 TRINITY_DN9751_c0_g1~~TRINITY_DN9751_c0_g1_i1.p1  ORF type:complete len:747 (-),score=227.40 TRINITY_DN9751_c0_g1_i1:501-2741(-)
MSVRRFTSAVARARAQPPAPRREYNFASAAYASSFGNLPPTQTPEVRAKALAYADEFAKNTPDLWYKVPIRSSLRGEDIAGTDVQTTVSAFGKENGRIEMASSDTVQAVISHLKNYVPPENDLREKIRSIEQELLRPEISGILVANQALDFQKQDGLTEIEESVEANTVERRLNDLLMADEAAGRVVIDRSPNITAAVSNFSTFLDLFRKTIRCLEVGIPIVVFSRNNTTQYVYRWFLILRDLLAKHGVDSGMLTFLAADVAAQREVMKALPQCPMNFTGSREVAARIKEVNPKLGASTGGPNTMVCAGWTPETAAAFQMSATIENSGQCTALRHLVAPISTDGDEIRAAFDNVKIVPSAVEALRAGAFDACIGEAPVAKTTPGSAAVGYERHAKVPVQWRVSWDLPPSDIDEYWRSVVVDATAVPSADAAVSEGTLSRLSEWLIDRQPISCVVNGRTEAEAFRAGAFLWERSALVVFSLGTLQNPALTAQARPQVAEIFGEVPPRKELDRYTAFPVLGPSSTPSYNARYNASYLTKLGEGTAAVAEGGDAHATPTAPAGFQWLDDVVAPLDAEGRGYVRVIQSYVAGAAVGARRGFDDSGRTALWGLQRPPLQKVVVLRANADSSAAELVAMAMPFVMTNAGGQLVLSVDAVCADQPAIAALSRAVNAAGGDVVVEDTAAADRRAQSSVVWNYRTAPAALEHIVAGPYVSRLVAVGHLKYNAPKADAFVRTLSESRKWLRAMPRA